MPRLIKTKKTNKIIRQKTRKFFKDKKNEAKNSALTTRKETIVPIKIITQSAEKQKTFYKKELNKISNDSQTNKSNASPRVIGNAAKMAHRWDDPAAKLQGIFKALDKEQEYFLNLEKIKNNRKPIKEKKVISYTKKKKSLFKTLDLRTKKAIIWLGTIVIFLVLILIWGIIFKNNLTAISLEKTDNNIEKNSLDNVKKDWETFANNFRKNLSLVSQINELRKKETNPQLNNQELEKLKNKIIEEVEANNR